MAHIGGKRVGKSHSTVIEAAEIVVRYLQKIPIVTNIVLGKIDVHLPPTNWRIKMTEITNGWKLQIRGTNSIQTIYVYTGQREEVVRILKSEFGARFVFV